MGVVMVDKPVTFSKIFLLDKGFRILWSETLFFVSVRS